MIAPLASAACCDHDHELDHDNSLHLAYEPDAAAPLERGDALPGPRPFDLERIERGVRLILQGLGENLDRDGLRDTPKRVARAYRDLCAGLREDAAVHLGRVFQQQHHEVILVRDIEFFSLCEHHLLPFHGKAHVAYLPSDGRIVGLSKLARTVEVFARRPQVQERLTDQVADAIVEHLAPAGVMVMIEAAHLCMKMRGVKSPHSTMVTTARRGLFRDDPLYRSELTQLMLPGR